MRSFPLSFSSRRVGPSSLASLTLAALFVGGLTGCPPNRLPGDDDPGVDVDGGTDPDPVGSLTLTPAETSVTLRGTDVTIPFKATSPKYGDVTGSALWSVSDNSIGAVVAGRLTVRGNLMNGGAYTVSASFRNQSGNARVNIQPYLPDVVDPSAPADAKDWFGGGAGGTAPAIVYPFDNTMMAPNILQVRIQWQAGGSNKVFRIDAQGPTVQRSFYFGCTGNCTYNIDDKLWSSLARSSLNQTVKLTISGVAAKGGPVGISAPINVRFSPEDARGGLYYFSPTITGIKRVPLGASAPVDFIRNGNETGCAGCHGISRDGKQVAVEFGSGDTRTGSGIVDGANPMQRKWALTPSIAWNYAWFNPTGDRIIANWRSTLVLRNTTDGNQVGQITNQQIGGSFGGAMPEWSPDGKYIAFVRNLQSSTYDFELNSSGDIVVIPYNNGAFGQATLLVKGDPANDVHIWPTWSPDSKWLVFNSHACGGSCNSYNAATTRLRIVRAIDDNGNPAQNPQPIELLEGTYKPRNTNNWPKFAPFLQQNRYAFVTYSANYGWGHQGGGRPQLFMFGVDLDAAKQGKDPSFKPIWLPFQEPSTGNHSAIWTTDVACTTDNDCPREFQCTQGQCVPRLG